LIREVIGTPPDGEARFVDTCGIAGIGKTEFIRRVVEIASVDHGIAAVPLFVDRVSAPTNLDDAYNTFFRHVKELAHRLDEWAGRVSRAGQFENELAQINQEAQLVKMAPRVDVDARGATITGSEVGTLHAEIKVKVGGELAGVVYGRNARKIADAFAEHFRSAFKRKPLLITIDGYDEIAGTDLSAWLLDALDGLTNALVILGRTPLAGSPPVEGKQRFPAPLPLFTRVEVAELLRKHLQRKPDESLVEAVYSWSEGHPGAAAIAAKFLCAVDDPQAATIEERLAAAPEDVERARAELALEFVSTLGGEAFAELAHVSAIPHFFDEDLLAELLGKDVAARGIDVLCSAGLVEPVDDSLQTFRVHGFLREPIQRLMRDGVRKRLHQRAASHDYELLSAEEPELESGARPYEGWYRYEKPEWQATLREWLYHQREAARTEHEKERARLQFAHIFLDAFWWWGCYMDFPFCRDLIADWERERHDDGAWAADLRRLIESYPLGWRKQGAPEWVDVEAALIAIRRECGVAGSAESLSGPEARHTRALIDNFLAHSCRYRAYANDAEQSKLYDRAVGYYGEAQQLFEKGSESWELAWTLFETAELHCDNSELATTRRIWQEAVAAALDEDDFELTANLHRLCADIRWHEGDKAEAFAAHAHAVLHAYLFQSMTPSHRPDAYTVAFYLEHVERVFERLSELEAPALSVAVETLSEPFEATTTVDAVAEAIEAADPHALAGTLFPAAPEGDEILSTRSALTDRIDLLAEQLGDVGRDLATVEP
jgi:hypothetical protein